MNFLDALHTSATGLSAQRFRMNLISSNLANANTTKTKEGGPYKRKDAVFRAIEGGEKFNGILRRKLDKAVSGVEVTRIAEDPRPPITKFDPGHPDADENGYVAMPNINIVEEMVNMISASRSYEANVTAVKSTKDMAMAALEIGR